MGPDRWHSIALGGRWPWLGLVGVIAVAGLLELLVGALVIRALLDPPWSTALEWLLGAATVALLLVLASPLAASARVGPDGLRIRFGLLGGLSAPAAALASVQEYHPDALHPVSLGIEAGATVSAASFSRGSGTGCVLIRFTAEQPVRHQVLRRSPARAVVLRVAQPDRAVAAIRAAAAPPDARAAG